MTLCGARRFAGWSCRHNVKPRTPRNAPFPPTWGGDGAPFVAPTSKWASVLLTVAMTLLLPLPLPLPRPLSHVATEVTEARLYFSPVLSESGEPT